MHSSRRYCKTVKTSCHFSVFYRAKTSLSQLFNQWFKFSLWRENSTKQEVANFVKFGNFHLKILHNPANEGGGLHPQTVCGNVDIHRFTLVLGKIFRCDAFLTKFYLNSGTVADKNIHRKKYHISYGQSLISVILHLHRKVRFESDHYELTKNWFKVIDDSKT